MYQLRTSYLKRWAMEGYTKTSILARGTFGTVYLGHSLLKTRQQVVIKEIQLGTMAGQVDSSESQTEVKVLKLLCHPNIIKIYQSTVHNDMLCMVSYGVENFLPETIFFWIWQKRHLSSAFFKILEWKDWNYRIMKALTQILVNGENFGFSKIWLIRRCSKEKPCSYLVV